jgi:Spy/CpxP family protein refolding chaperone
MKEKLMTDNDNNAPLPPEPPTTAPVPPAPPAPRGARTFTWPRALAYAGVLALGVGIGAVGAGGLAIAQGMDHFGWRHGPRLAIVQAVVTHALDSVGASAAQEARIHDIVAAKFADIAPDPKQHEAMRKQALDLLSAPTIDRAAVEKLRADAVANFDAKSKVIVGAVLDVADQLTPTQRSELAARIGEMAQRGPMGPWGGWRHGPMDDGPMGPPDGGPDKN